MKTVSNIFEENIKKFGNFRILNYLLKIYVLFRQNVNRA